MGKRPYDGKFGAFIVSDVERLVDSILCQADEYAPGVDESFIKRLIDRLQSELSALQLDDGVLAERDE